MLCLPKATPSMPDVQSLQTLSDLASLSVPCLAHDIRLQWPYQVMLRSPFIQCPRNEHACQETLPMTLQMGDT